MVSSVAVCFGHVVCPAVSVVPRSVSVCSYLCLVGPPVVFQGCHAVSGEHRFCSVRVFLEEAAFTSEYAIHSPQYSLTVFLIGVYLFGLCESGMCKSVRDGVVWSCIPVRR